MSYPANPRRGLHQWLPRLPTRGGSQLLWTGNLGTRVTYGCILLGTEQINALYDWAEEGVVVEIQDLKEPRSPPQ